MLWQRLKLLANDPPCTPPFSASFNSQTKLDHVRRLGQRGEPHRSDCHKKPIQQSWILRHAAWYHRRHSWLMHRRYKSTYIYRYQPSSARRLSIHLTRNDYLFVAKPFFQKLNGSFVICRCERQPGVYQKKAEEISRIKKRSPSFTTQTRCVRFSVNTKRNSISIFQKRTKMTLNAKKWYTFSRSEIWSRFSKNKWGTYLDNKWN